MIAKSSIIKVAKLKFDTDERISADQSSEWVLGILNELNENVDEEDLEDLKRQSPQASECHLKFSADIKKVKNSKYKEVVLVEGELSAKFMTYCVSSGKLMSDVMECEVLVAAIDKSLQQSLGFDEEVIDIEVDGQEYDLYYFESNQLDLAPILHEYIYLNKNPYPRLQEEN